MKPGAAILAGLAGLSRFRTAVLRSKTRGVSNRAKPTHALALPGFHRGEDVRPRRNRHVERIGISENFVPVAIDHDAQRISLIVEAPGASKSLAEIPMPAAA